VNAVEPRFRNRWIDHLRAVGRGSRPALYADPAWVAHRLHSVTKQRPRLSFAVEEIPTVVLALRDARPKIFASAGEVVAQVRFGLVD
jgi:hypothetical protein